jgi:ubiquinone/menaquinone biosynthesis C-methylase UbiE
MACHGGFSLDEKARRAWYSPEEILSKAGLKDGIVFADIGSGDGFFSLLAAETVGETGKVYAVDADAQAISRLKSKASERGLKNVHALVGEAENVVFCRGCVDVVFFSMALHDFHDPVKVLQNAKVMLKASGCVVDLDWKKMQMPFGPPVQIRFSKEKARELMEQVGFHVASVDDVGPYHYILTAKSR